MYINYLPIQMKFKNLTMEDMNLIFEINEGNNYALGLFQSRGGENINRNDSVQVKKDKIKNQVKIIRHLNNLSDEGWLIKDNKTKRRHRKIYSINWDFIIKIFIKHLIEKVEKDIISQIEFWHSQDFIVKREKKRYFNIEKKTPEQKKKEADQIKEIKRCILDLKNTRKKDRILLKPFFEKDVFVIAYEHYIIVKRKPMPEITMWNLFDEIILGIGKSLAFITKKKIYPTNTMITALTFLCLYIYKAEQINLHNSFSRIFGKKFLN